MASLKLTTAMSLRQPEVSDGAGIQRKSTNFKPCKKPISLSFAATSPEAVPSQPQQPEIELEFIGVRTLNFHGWIFRYNIYINKYKFFFIYLFFPFGVKKFVKSFGGMVYEK